MQIPGFYDGIGDPRRGAAAAMARPGLRRSARSSAPVGLSRPAGERGPQLAGAALVAPDAEINGIFGGYTGPGTKTVIPAEASAKITFRLVPGQRPDEMLAGFKSFRAAHLPRRLPRRPSAILGGSPAIGFDTGCPRSAARPRRCARNGARNPC